ncbi:hypothetical protein AB0N05_21180 [Nocardia sp. NPDC051030]|uniref:hypothetical protein n=1 Tax=Nocardia sp. NPDC051030 TaxID=3155162 RepID=UPI0034355D50
MNATDRSEEAIYCDGRIQVSLVELYSPLPQDFPAHPERLDRLAYLRYRLADGPDRAEDADAILVIQPGNFLGPHSLDGVARGSVLAAADKGRVVEFWALARRSEGADDPTGVMAALAANDPDIAFDYYFGGATVAGRAFEGFRSGGEQPFLAELGFARVVRDLHEILVREIPDSQVRRRKVFLGGHSGGASVTAAFGSWDFDGTPGHDMCRGFIALDTPLDCHFGLRSNTALRVLSAPFTAAAGLAYPWVVRALRAGRLHRSSGRLSTMAIEVNRLLGLYAHLTPHAEGDLLRRVTESVEGSDLHGPWRMLVRLLSATTLRQARTGRPDPLDRRLTCAAEFGMWIGSGVTPNIGRIGIGALDGPVRTRSFPAPAWLWRVPVLRGPVAFVFGYRPLVAPADRGHLYSWRNEPGPGQPADFAATARAVAGGPRSAVEPYHPVRFPLDQTFALLGVRSGDLAAIRHERGMRAKPLLSVFESHVPLAPYIPLMNTGVAHVIPGYAHDDIPFATPRPDGSPEPVSDHIADFVAAHTTAEFAATDIAMLASGGA